ncbi:hypothetical protein Tco_0477778 [Tanacetum coccineum]
MSLRMSSQFYKGLNKAILYPLPLYPRDGEPSLSFHMDVNAGCLKIIRAESSKDVLVSSKIGDTSLVCSFRRIPRGGFASIINSTALLELVSFWHYVPWTDRWNWELVYLSSLFDFVSCLPFGSLKMSDVERADMGSQAEASSSNAMCWRHHDLDISDPAPKDGFDEDDVITLTHQPIDIRGLIPTAANPSDAGKVSAQEETSMPDPLSKGVGADGPSLLLPPFLFVPSWGFIRRCPSDHDRREVPVIDDHIIPLYLESLCSEEEMNLLDNNIVLDRAWFSLARGAMAQAHALSVFESLYDTHHALQESLDDTRWKLREEHAQCSEGLAVVRAERDSLMATNAEQALRIKELEQQLKNADEVHSSAVKDLENQLAQKDSALVYAERISGERLSENEGLKAQLDFAQKEKTKAVRELLPTVVKRLLQSHEYKQSLSVPFNFALQTGWGQGLAEGRSEKELHQIMMRMNGFDPYSDKKMTAEYERLFSKTYPYVDRISHLSEKPVQDLLKPSSADLQGCSPNARFRPGIAFAPKLVRAAEVAGSKDHCPLIEFSLMSMTWSALQDPASNRTSGGSKGSPI